MILLAEHRHRFASSSSSMIVCPARLMLCARPKARGASVVARRGGQMFHAAGLSAGIRQSNPGADLLMRIEAEIGTVLMPGGEGRRVGLLDEERTGPDQDVGADHVLDRIEDPGMVDQRVEPGRWA